MKASKSNYLFHYCLTLSIYSYQSLPMYLYPSQCPPMSIYSSLFLSLYPVLCFIDTFLTLYLFILSQSLSTTYHIPSILQGVKEPHMFAASVIRRATEMKAPFLQCLKNFHTISIRNLHGKHNVDNNLKSSKFQHKNVKEILIKAVFSTGYLPSSKIS